MTALITTLVFAAQTNAAPNATPQQMADYNRAGSLLGNGHFLEARKILLALSNTSAGQTNAELLCKLAECYYQDEKLAHHLKLCQEQVEKAIAINPEYGIAYRMMAAVAYNREDFPTSERWASKALSCKQPDHLALWVRARSNYEDHKKKEALADVNQFLKGLPKPTIQNYAFKGELLRSMGRLDEAITTYKEASRLGKDWAVYQVVNCLELENKLDEAIKELDGLIATNPIDDDAYHLRARMFAKKKNYKRAIADLSKAIELEPLGSYHKERAAIYELLGEHDLAKKDLAEEQKSF